MKFEATLTRKMFSTAAIVFAVAAACLQVTLAAPYLGVGLAIARVGEHWAQRLLPGNYRVPVVDPSWFNEASIAGSERISYTMGRPEQGWNSYWLCPTNIGFTIIVGLMVVGWHLLTCRLVAKAGDRGVDPADRMAFVRRLARWSILWCGLGYLLYQFLRWFWAGAYRGDVTQRVVGEKIALIAFGPFGRTLLLLGAIIMYGVLIGWTARYLAQSRSKRERIVLLSLTAVVVVLLMFPYWSGWALPVLGPNRFVAISDWARESPLRDALNVLAPAP